MKFEELTTKAKLEMGYMVFCGLNEAMNHDITPDKKKYIEEIMSWYESNIILSYDTLKEKFDRVFK